MIIRLLTAWLFACLTLSGCYYSHPNETDHWTTMGEGTVDSVNFYIGHHYWIGYNFRTTDSLKLLINHPQQSISSYGKTLNETIRIQPREELVVARVTYIPHDTIDSVWVKVAHDQLTQGWLHERDLLENAVPDDPISKFIYHFSDSRTGYVAIILGMAVLFGLIQGFRRKHYRMVHFRDIPSFYPTLLCLCVSGSAVLYGSIQRFIPSTWVEFYFHPTLNPLNGNIPLIMALFIASVWIILIVAVAVIDEIRRQPDLGDNLSYLASLGGVCMILYLIFTLTTPLYIGYPLLIAYWVFAIRQYWIHQPSHMLCGLCRKPIPHKGKCPHCGAFNR